VRTNVGTLYMCMDGTLEENRGLRMAASLWYNLAPLARRAAMEGAAVGLAVHTDR
jgi:hypothetical protein